MSTTTGKELPLVSVIVPTAYADRADRLASAIASIWAQEGLGDQFDIEVIVDDDTSTGSTGAHSPVASLDLVRKRLQQLEGRVGDIQDRIEETNRQQLALTNIRPLLSLLPVPFGDWAINAFFGQEIVFTLMEERPKLVVECGSGSSTVLMAACLRQLGQGRLIALEHDARYARRTESLLTSHRLDEVVKVIEAPLEKRVIDGIGFEWYSDVFERHVSEDIDVLVVDGPPGNTGPRARYPAVPLLKKALSPNCVILLDDANRSDEQWIGKKWAEELGWSSEYTTHGNGSWVIRNST